MFKNWLILVGLLSLTPGCDRLSVPQPKPTPNRGVLTAYEVQAEKNVTNANRKKSGEALQHGATAYQKGQYAEVIKYFDLSTKYNPATRYSNQILKASALYKMGQKDQAIPLLDEVIASNSLEVEVAKKARYKFLSGTN